ncbi:D-sedoheptulose 7-phosphate isomerase [Mucilaginibacter pallidiroseus]|uniref:Phosphoheptose isomerase n=1 Tax=Mucilaginibacter pallidiroseus TaxID=2599295 RepID=A0A563UIQ9_9SPHI|nr:D-sedoheptulose 7-phosphate isomerase [Mucilaginibacter pallidiroseus]TWR31183.1 D-sedoheptulose 7-phosphate isomerase [Mucilaginibacter pallidiroseus]
MPQDIKDIFDNHINVAKNTFENLKKDIEQTCSLIVKCSTSGKKIILFGNGGSAADAQHIAAEFIGRFVKERRSLPAIALTTDTSALTAISNDYGYDRVFERQVLGLAVAGDVLIGLSTSGNSPNVINALVAGKAIGCITIGLSGRDGGQMNSCCDVNLIVPSDITARVQEMHILIGHIICGAVDDAI